MYFHGTWTQWSLGRVTHKTSTDVGSKVIQGSMTFGSSFCKNCHCIHILSCMFRRDSWFQNHLFDKWWQSCCRTLNYYMSENNGVVLEMRFVGAYSIEIINLWEINSYHDSVVILSPVRFVVLLTFIEKFSLLKDMYGLSFVCKQNAALSHMSAILPLEGSIMFTKIVGNSKG